MIRSRPPHRAIRASGLVVLLVLSLLARAGLAQSQTRPPGSRPMAPHRHLPGDHFEGRPIAEVMSFLGADWLLRDSRDHEEQPERLLDALQIQPGMTVADVGAGVGFHSLRIAPRVEPGGVVYATDVQPQMLRRLIQRAEAAGATNVVPVLCTQTYTGLPPGSVDLILLVDVYHEMSDPEASLAGLHRALKPGGRLVLVEFRAEDPEVPIRLEHKMTAQQIQKELEPRGFRLLQIHEFLPWQHAVEFEKPADLPPAP